MIDLLKKKSTKITVIFLAIMLLFAFLLAFHFSLQRSFFIVISCLASLVLPGFFLSLLFFPNSRLMTDENSQRKDLDNIERLTACLLLSIIAITFVPMVLLAVKIAISPAIFAITIISANVGLGILVLIFWLKRKQIN